MQKNWYILYTKQRCEKKVSSLLTKKKIENFCPLNCKQVINVRKSKTIYQPLFDSYVFAYVKDDEIPVLKLTEGVVSLVYWKGEPATIKDEEIKAIKEFTSIYTDIKLEKTRINFQEQLRNVDEPSFKRDGNIFMVKNRSFKVYLPSMGFVMTAEMKDEGMMGRDILFGNKEFLLQ